MVAQGPAEKLKNFISSRCWMSDHHDTMKGLCGNFKVCISSEVSTSDHHKMRKRLHSRQREKLAFGYRFWCRTTTTWLKRLFPVLSRRTCVFQFLIRLLATHRGLQKTFWTVACKEQPSAAAFTEEFRRTVVLGTRDTRLTFQIYGHTDF